MDGILTLSPSWKEGEHYKRTNSNHGMMLKGFFSVSMQVKREAKCQPILKAHVESPENLNVFPALKPGKPFVTLAESPEPRLILWQLSMARKLMFLKYLH